jgi:predicted dehydrogenase
MAEQVYWDDVKEGDEIPRLVKNCSTQQLVQWAAGSGEGGGRIVGEACHFVDLARFLVGERIAGVFAEAAPPLAAAQASLEANPPHGARGEFVKVTVTLPPEIYGLIAQEAMRRKMAKERDPLISAIVREAIVAYLEAGRMAP